VDALAELATVRVKGSTPNLIFCAFLYTRFFLVSSLSGDLKPTCFMAVAVEIKPSGAANSCAAIRSFSSSDRGVSPFWHVEDHAQ